MKSGWRLVFSRGVILASFFVAIFLMLVLASIVWFSRPPANPPAASTAILNVIRVPTSTSTLWVITPQVIETATAEVQPSEPLPITLGSNVEVQGTGGAGLRIRQSPGLGQRVLFLANEGEAFLVQEGPQELDGYVWWYVVNPADQSRSGWAVADYLQVVLSP
jgi:hypothetical protein